MSNPDVKVDELVAKDHGTKIKTFEEVANERDAQKLEEEKARVSFAYNLIIMDIFLRIIEVN